MGGVRAIFDKYGVAPRKRFGQNFLVRDGYVEAVARAADISENDVVLEIGAGIGNLTKALAARAEKVIAVEFDRDMLKVLHGELDLDNVQILDLDALKIDYNDICPDKKIIAVSNLPYNIATEIIFRLFDAAPRFKRMLLMTQLEVARRFTAAVGSKDYGILAVMSGMWARAKIQMIVPAGAFFPRPKVKSAVVRFDMFEENAARVDSIETYSRIVHAAFAQRRKMISNSIASSFIPKMEKAAVEKWLTEAGIDPKTRAQNLTVEDFARLETFFPFKKR